MPVPKSRTSKMRKHKRRTHYKAKMPSWILCPNCKNSVLAHNVCRTCGYYKTEKIIEVKDNNK